MDLWTQYTEKTQRLAEETTCCIQEDVTLYDGDSKTRFRHGQLTLTSHRFVWQASGTSIQLPLSRVTHAESKSGMLFGSKKIKLGMQRGGHMLLAFNGQGRNSTLTQLGFVLKMKSWESNDAAAGEDTPAHGRMMFGLAGLDRRARERAQQQTAMSQDAFSDLDSLVKLAKPMVDLAESLKGRLQSHNGALSDEDIKLTELLENVGIYNPVTKDSVKKSSQFHRALAEEIASALARPLEAARGMLVLPEAYCIHSRMRGTQLVSPQDLLQACELLATLGAGMRVHRFPSGVAVLRSDARDDVSICEEMRRLVSGDRECITILEVADELDLSILLAEECVRISEARGVLCRDQSLEATRYFVNKFCVVP